MYGFAMAGATDLLELPDGLPEPADDGAADHLPGAVVPAIALPATSGDSIRLDDPDAPRTVVFCYPRTATPGVDPPGGMDAWNAIPGARGCSVQATAFARRAGRLAELGVRVFGLSTQDSPYQREMADRLGLPFPVLSDERLELARALSLPTFEHERTTLLKRLTLVLRAGRVEHAIYPVFPPQESPDAVIAWLESHPSGDPAG